MCSDIAESPVTPVSSDLTARSWGMSPSTSTHAGQKVSDRRNEVALQFSQKQCLHPNTNTDAWHIVAFYNCFGLSQELTARRWKLCFSWCTNIRDVRMLNQPNTDIHSGLDTLPQPATAPLKETIIVQLENYNCQTPGSITYVAAVVNLGLHKALISTRSKRVLISLVVQSSITGVHCAV